MRFKFVAIVFALSLIFIQCKKPTAPEVIEIEVTPGSVDFGVVLVGMSSDQTITVKNSSASTGNLTGSVSVSGEGFSLVGDASFNIEPGGSASITVRFTPTAGGSYTGTLEINHNATNQGSPVKIQLIGTGDDRVERVKNLISSGWQLFESKKYTDAEVKFDSAVVLSSGISVLDSLKAEAWLGRGWSRAHLEDMDNAKLDLLSSAGVQSANPRVILGAKAGLAFVHHALNEYNNAIKRANEVLNEDANYVFEHDSRVYYKRLRLVLAQSYYSIGDFQKAASELDILDPANAPHSTDPVELLRAIQELWSRI